MHCNKDIDIDIANEEKVNSIYGIVFCIEITNCIWNRNKTTKTGLTRFIPLSTDQ